MVTGPWRTAHDRPSCRRAWRWWIRSAAFCMMSRHVDGLATIAPEDPALYAASAQHLIKEGYLPPPAA